jgi:hypothetical protein
MPRLVWPSWRWMTISGTPSRAISTACAWRSWCGAKRRRTPATRATRRSSQRAAAAVHGRPRVAPLTTQNSGPTGSSIRAWSQGASCSQAQSSMPTSRRRPPLPRRTSSDPRRASRSASASASASQMRRPARQRTTIRPRNRRPWMPSPAWRSRAVRPEVGVREPVARGRHVVQQVDVGVQLLHVRVDDCLEHAVQQIGHETGKRDGVQDRSRGPGHPLGGDARELVAGGLRRGERLVPRGVLLRHQVGSDAEHAHHRLGEALPLVAVEVVESRFVEQQRAHDAPHVGARAGGVCRRDRHPHLGRADSASARVACSHTAAASMTGWGGRGSAAIDAPDSASHASNVRPERPRSTCRPTSISSSR